MFKRAQMLFIVASVCAITAIALAAVDRSGHTSHKRNISIATESTIFAQRGQGVVTQLDFDVYLARLEKHHRSVFLQSDNRIGDALGALMTPRQLVAEAKENAPELIEDPLFQGQLFQTFLVQVADRYMNYLWEKERLDDYSRQARELYLKSPNLFDLPQRVTFSQILVPITELRDEVSAMHRILGLHAKINGDESIDGLKLGDSENAAAGQSDRLEAVELSQLDETVAAAIKSLKSGEISHPFRSKFGWHILQLHDVVSPGPPDFEQIQEQALDLAETRHEQAFRERILRRLYAEKTIVAQGAVEKLRNRYSVTENDLEQLKRDVSERLGVMKPQ